MNQIFCGLPFLNYPVDINCVSCERAQPALPVVLTYFFLSKIQGEIVDVFMTFTRPVIQSADHEEGK